MNTVTNKDGISLRQQKDPYFCCEYTSQYHQEKDVKLRGDHPQQNVFFFKDGEKHSEYKEGAIIVSS